MPEKCTSDFHRKCAERAFSTVKRYRATRSSPTTESFTAPGREGAVFSCCTKILCCKTWRQTGLRSSIGDYTCSVVHWSTENLKVLEILVYVCWSNWSLQQMNSHCQTCEVLSLAQKYSTQGWVWNLTHHQIFQTKKGTIWSNPNMVELYHYPENPSRSAREENCTC